MDGLRVASVAFVCTLVACTHDFDTFQPNTTGEPVDAGSGDAALVDSSSGDGANFDSSSGDAAGFDSGSGDSAAFDSSSGDSGTLDSGAGDSGPPCSDPGATVFMGHCYFPTTSPQTWDMARTTCVAASAHLVTITTAAEQLAVQALVPIQEHWIGLSRPLGSPAIDASYVWIDGEARGYSDWEPGEPNGSGECVRLRVGGLWADNVCAIPLVAICERE